MIAPGEFQADPLLDIHHPARLVMRKSPPLGASSSSSKLAPVTACMSHTVLRTTVLQPHAPSVNKTGGTRSTRYRGESVLSNVRD